jgi:hypothetical protein
MTFVMLWGAVLGFVNGYNAAIWVVILITGVGALTIIDMLMEAHEDSDVFEPRRTYSSTSREIVHMERPRRRFHDDDEFD